MDNEALLNQIERLKDSARKASNSHTAIQGVKAQVSEFLSEFAGEKSSFLRLASGAIGRSDNIAEILEASLDNFKSYVEAGLHNEITPTRKAQLDVVSDFLEQAHVLLGAKSVHPAAPIVLIGATLEEFLRTWLEGKGLSLGQKKPSLDSYAQVLLSEGLITKQDMKDITAWGGLRNHAAHGEWSEVSDKQRASIMLDGVNLFMRKYSS